MTLIVSYSGIRGLVGAGLTVEVAERYARAFGHMVVARHRSPTILLARDTRPSGPLLMSGIVRGLQLGGVGTLVDLGVIPTPTLQHALGALGADAALCVTASHNPEPWNGFKLFLAPELTILDGAQMAELQRAASADMPPRADAGEAPGARLDRHEDAIALHLERVCALLDVEKIRAAGLRVAVDSGGGAGEEITLRLLERLGCAAVAVRADRPSEPLAENLGALSRTVVESACDLGVAQDLDADRLALVAEDGAAPGEELTLVLAVDHLLARGHAVAPVVVKNIATSVALDDVVRAHGAALVETAVGEIHLSRALAAQRRAGRVAFGGEGNGGVIVPELHLGRDSIMGIGVILERLATPPRERLSQHLARMPRYRALKRKVEVAPGADALHAICARVQDAFAPDGVLEVSRLDGLRLRFADNAWVGVRASNTEPVVRITAESRSPAWAAAAIERLEAAVRSPSTAG